MTDRTAATTSETGADRFYVYALYRDEAMTDPFYVGKGNGRRLHRHENAAEIAKRHNVEKNNTIKKLIADLGYVPKGIVRANLSEIDAFALESLLIDKFGRLDISTGRLTNRSDGGDGASPSAETRAKIRLARSRQVMTQETKDKIAAAGRGRSHSAEARAKMSAARKGIAPKLSPEARARQLAAVRGRKHTDKARASMSKTRTGRKLAPSHVEAIAKWHRGRKRSDEARANMRAGRKGMKLSAAHKQAISESLKRYNNDPSRCAVDKYKVGGVFPRNAEAQGRLPLRQNVGV